MPLNACLQSNAIAHICNMKVVVERAPSVNFDVKKKPFLDTKTWKTFAGTEIEFFII